MYQRLQCHACCRVFDHRDELQSQSTIWCPFCSAVYIWPVERDRMFKPHPGAGRAGGKFAKGDARNRRGVVRHLPPARTRFP